MTGWSICLRAGKISKEWRVTRMCKSPEYICTILPPHILTKMTESNRHRERALRTIALTERARGRRSILGTMPGSVPAGTLRRTIYDAQTRSEEHTSELQSHSDLVCRLLPEKKK